MRRARAASRFRERERQLARSVGAARAGRRLARGSTEFAPHTLTVSPAFPLGSGGRHRLFSSHAVSATACPPAASRANTFPKSSTPDRFPPDASSAKASGGGRGVPLPDESVTGTSVKIASTSLVRTLPGPTSRNVRAPAAAIARISSTNATGLARWLASRSFAAPSSVGYSLAVVFANTGGPPWPLSAVPSSAARKGTAASATNAEWNAAATGSRVAFTPASENARSGALDVRCGAGEDRLARGVAVRHDDVELFARDDRVDVRGRGERGEHRAGIAWPRIGHQLPAHAGEREQVALLHPPGGGQRDEFTVTVPGEGIGFHAEPLGQYAPRAVAHRAERRLRVAGVAQVALEFFLALGVEGGGRVDAIREPSGVGVVLCQFGEGAVRAGQCVERFREQAHEFAEHSNELRPLTGEQHREFARGRTATVVRAVECVPVPRVRLGRELRFCAGEEFRQIGQCAVNREAQPTFRGRAERSARLPRARRMRPRRRDPPQPPPCREGVNARLASCDSPDAMELRRSFLPLPAGRGAGVGPSAQQLHQPIHLLDQLLCGVRAKCHHFNRTVPVRLALLRPVFFQYRVEVATAEAERGQRRRAAGVPAAAARDAFRC